MKEEGDNSPKSRLEEKGVKRVTEGEISHGGVKPKTAGRNGGMDEGVKEGIGGLDTMRDSGRASPRILGSAGDETVQSAALTPQKLNASGFYN